MTTVIVLLLIIILLLLILIWTFYRFKERSGSGDPGTVLRTISSELSRIDPLIRDEFSRNREEIRNTSKGGREELSNSFRNLSETLQNSFRDTKEELSKSLKSFEDRSGSNAKDFNEVQRQKFDDLAVKLERIKETVETNLQKIQEQNSKKLDEIRGTVDEKLQSTLEKRFNESFNVISNRLDQVHQGLGEMQKLAAGVGDLKKVLTNVKTRGNLGEIQLGSILEQIFSPEQYSKNSIVKPGTLERVEYTIKLPGRNSDSSPLLLPIDSKFPNEDYQRLVEAYENAANIEDANKQFEFSIKKNAKDIRDKYINPPLTTDFAIMFVPTEGLYAEVLRRTGLFEFLQREYRVTVVGPTNLVAFLSSLQMGFRTLAIEKRSSEVWQILGAVKTQFGDFGKILDKTKKKLQEVTNVIEDAGTRSRVIERKLRTVQELPSEESAILLGRSVDLDDDVVESPSLDDEQESEQRQPELPFWF